MDPSQLKLAHMVGRDFEGDLACFGLADVVDRRGLALVVDAIGRVGNSRGNSSPREKRMCVEK